ncbi:hypothetical protein, partial [Xanthomonas vesicatoria]|uniref:hypothetical protein n=1 Tax=Xanthomonas vesicatoria TaxID=56460 RepID=UPI001C12BCE9
TASGLMIDRVRSSAIGNSPLGGPLKARGYHEKNPRQNAGLGFFAMVNSIPSQRGLHTAP